MHAAITEITRLLPFPAASLAQRLRAVGGAVSQAAVLILPQIKLATLTLCVLIFFLTQHRLAAISSLSLPLRAGD